MDLETLKVISKLDQEPLIEEHFKKKFQSYFFEYFRHNFLDDASKGKNI